jgi:AraC-like DNA-binding protein
MPPEDFKPVHLSTAVEAPHRRAELAREVFGREILRLDVLTVPDEEFHVDLKLWNLPNLKMISGSTSGVITPRTRSLLSDGNDDVFFTFIRAGRMGVEQRGESALLERGDSHTFSNAERATHTHLGSLSRGLLAPRASIADLVPDIDNRLGKVLPRQTPGLQLLRNYAAAFDRAGSAPAGGLTQTFVSHLHDLVAMVLGASRDGQYQIANRGLKAARLQAIKTYVVRNVADGGLSIDVAAASQGLTRRQVQRLFEEDGTTFSTFVQQSRLRLAHTLLSSSAQGHRSISAVAFDCGFGDVSHFNHAFRRAYGATPSDIRHQSPTRSMKLRSEADDRSDHEDRRLVQRRVHGPSER